ncbi:MAG: ATP-dependent Clp protease ATP-binding subunit, partial [Oscillospiraceae bacterium]|nr:ATP-dependent Clp protease ATP-binding subunit [Oscillospiraceae bacterium]
MVLCSKCKKRPAVVFVSALRGEESRNEGYCLVCARDLNIPQVSDYLKSHYINEDDLEDFSDRMMEMMQEDIPDIMEEELNNLNDMNHDEPISGTIDAMPNFLRSLFGGMPGMPSSGKPSSSMSGDFRENRKTERNQKKQKQDTEKQFKFLSNYCTNLSKRAENNELDRIIGRDREISRAMQILSRRTKN